LSNAETTVGIFAFFGFTAEIRKTVELLSTFIFATTECRLGAISMRALPRIALLLPAFASIRISGALRFLKRCLRIMEAAATWK
jgi:hypothetical protein